MTPDDRPTLAELAERSGVEPRTLRSWVQQGLVPGPDRRGRDARYPASALERVLAVKVLRDRYGLSLGAIRRELMLADPARLRALAAEGRGEPASTAPPAGTAAAYLAELRAAGVFGRSRGRGLGAPTAAPGEGEPADGLARLTEALEAAHGGPAPRRARAEPWLRIPITADVELVVSGALPADQVARIERVADLVRAILTGGAADD